MKGGVTLEKAERIMKIRQEAKKRKED